MAVTSVNTFCVPTSNDVRELRKTLGLSRPDFAQLVGVDMRTVIRWETGAATPSGAAEAVITGLATALANDEEGEVLDMLVKAAAIGGLAYLLITLLGSASTKRPAVKGKARRTK